MRLFRVAPFFCLDLLVFEQIGTRSHASSSPTGSRGIRATLHKITLQLSTEDR
jgi:hypothetical protein